VSAGSDQSHGFRRQLTGDEPCHERRQVRRHNALLRLDQIADDPPTMPAVDRPLQLVHASERDAGAPDPNPRQIEAVGGADRVPAPDQGRLAERDLGSEFGLWISVSSNNSLRAASSYPSPGSSAPPGVIQYRRGDGSPGRRTVASSISNKRSRSSASSRISREVGRTRIGCLVPEILAPARANLRAPAETGSLLASPKPVYCLELSERAT